MFLLCSRVFGISTDRLKDKNISTLLKNQGVYNGLIAILLLFSVYQQDDGEYQSSGRVVIRLRDDGTPLNLDDRQQLNKGQAHAVAKEISYHASYGMNNTMVVL